MNLAPQFVIGGFQRAGIDAHLARETQCAEAIEIGGDRKRTAALIANQARLLRPRADNDAGQKNQADARSHRNTYGASDAV